MKNFIIVITMLFSIWNTELAFADSVKSDLKENLSILMQEMREQKDLTISPNFINDYNVLDVITALKTYCYDEKPEVREIAISMAWMRVRKNPSKEAKQTIFPILVDALESPHGLVNQHALKHLLSFQSAYFTPESKEVIHRLLIKSISPSVDIVKIVGVADMQEELDLLADLLKDQGSKSTIWAAKLARARLGVKEDLEEVIQTVKDNPNTHIRGTSQVYDLAYMRQLASINAVRDMLNSRETMVAMHRGMVGGAFAQYALDALTESIHGFPIKNKGAGLYSKDDIWRARLWMSKTSNYENKIKR